MKKPMRQFQVIDGELKLEPKSRDRGGCSDKRSSTFRVGEDRKVSIALWAMVIYREEEQHGGLGLGTRNT